MKRAGLVVAAVVLVAAAVLVDVFLGAAHLHRRDLATVGTAGNPLVFVLSSSVVEDLEKPQLDALSQSLSSALGLSVTVRVARSSEDAVAAFSEDGADVGLFALGEYLVVRERHRVEPVLKIIHRGGDDGTYASEIDVRASSELKKLRDLTGKKVAVVDRRSVNRFVLAAVLLAPMNVTWVDAATYGESMRMLRDGAVDAAAVFAGASREDQAVRALAVSASVPSEPVFVRASMSVETREKIAHGIKSVAPEVVQKLGDARAFETIDDHAYDGARRMIAELGMRSDDLLRTP